MRPYRFNKFLKGATCMKRIFALVLSLCLLLVSTGALAELTGRGQLPISDGTDSLTIWAPSFSNMMDFPNLPMTKWFEEKTGVKINWIEVPNADMTSLFNASIASGSYPDIYMISTSDLLAFAEDGIAVALDEAIDEYSVYLKARLDANPDIRQQLTAPDGHIYTFPRVDYLPSTTTPAKMWVYTEWLEAYKAATGASDPVTPDEFEAMLLYFKQNDMNGNGDPNDEIIITGNNNYGGEGGNPLAYILNGFCFLPFGCGGGQYVYVEDGKVTSDLLSDSLREGLKYANKLYNEGLIIDEAFTQSLVDMRSLTTTTKDNVKVACIPAPYLFRMLTAQSIENAVGFSDYTCLTPLQNPATGVSVTPGKSEYALYLRGIVTSACKNLELAIRWFDLFYSDEVIKNMAYQGIYENGDWSIEEGVTALNGSDKAVVKHISAEEQNRMWNAAFIGSTWKDEKIATALAAGGDDLHEMEAAKMMMGYRKLGGWPQVTWCNDLELAAERSELKTLIESYATNSMSEFTMGIRDINDDAAWEAYKDQLKADGYDRYIEVLAEYYGVQ